jgi:hypothetical protein
MSVLHTVTKEGKGIIAMYVVSYDGREIARFKTREKALKEIEEIYEDFVERFTELGEDIGHFPIEAYEIFEVSMNHKQIQQWLKKRGFM